MNHNVQGPITNEDIALMEKFKAYFSTAIDLITQTIRADRQYNDKIDPKVILQLNHQAHTLKWKDFRNYIMDQEEDEYMMGITYQNIFYKDIKLHRLIKKGWNNLNEYECMYMANGYLQKIRINVEKTDHMFVGENLYM